MIIDQLQEQCELGQQELMRMNYASAERILAEAERQAWEQRDFDTLSRLYMPLQEARRQRRQRCGEGVVHLDLVAANAFDHLNGRHVVENYPFGQLLVAGWGTIEPARQVRRLQQEHELFVETFLGAAYPTATGVMVAVIPLESDEVPGPAERSVEELRNLLPPHSFLLPEEQLPRQPRKGTAETYAEVMGLWERLHAPFLAEAEAQMDPVRKMEAYRTTLRVDYACELAHQRLADVARQMRS